MSRGFQGAVLKALGANEYVVEVVAAHDVTPGFRRVAFSSPSLLAAFDPGPTDYLRFWFPDPDEPDREVQRGYTITAADRAAGTFVVDFLIHDPVGPASGWAAACAPGDQVTATLYGSAAFTLPTPMPAGLLLIGDAASVPAINSILAMAPPHLPVEVVLSHADDDEASIPLTEHPRATVRRVPRELSGAGIVAQLDGRDWAHWYAWVATERTMVKAIKRALTEVHGFPKSAFKATAYWIHGRSMGTSRRGSVRAAAKASAEEAAGLAQRPGAQPAPAATGRAPAATARRWRSQAGDELLAPLRPTMRLAAVIQVLLSLAELVPFVLLAEVGRRLLAGDDVADQWPLARLALFVLGGATTASAALMLWLHVVDARFARDLRRRLLGKLARLPLGWFTERNAATVKQAVTDDTARLHYYVTHAAVDVVAAITSPLAVLAYLFVVDARVAAVLLLPILAYVVVFTSMMQASRDKIDDVARWSRRINGEAVAYLDGLEVVRTFGGAAASTFRRSLDEYLTFLGDWQRPFVAKKATAALLTDAMTFLTLIVVAGGVLVSTDHMAPADLLPFLFLGATFGGRLLALAYNAAGLREARAAAQRIGVTLTEPELAIRSAVAGERTGGRVGEVQLDGVTFGYRRDEPVLHDVDLTLAAGTVTALVGPSGSGKSTLAALIARFHDPQAGTVRVGGDDVRDLDADELYRRVGFVLQDVHLIRASLHDNIALARPDADRATVHAAARAAQIDELADRLPRGYDTIIGHDVALSGGEAQRVAIARALLADTPIVLLDEATAFADPESERQVQLALGRLLAGRTVVAIAHRLHTVVDSDRIVVLDGGRVVQDGTHAELVAADGRYRDLWKLHQLGSVA